MLKIVLLLSLCFSGTIAGFSNEISGKVIAVIDGNTIEIESSENGIQRVVLFGIDSPELDQNFGNAARTFLQKIVFNKKVSVELKGKDRTGNYLGVVLINDDDVRVELLKAGLAWTKEKDPDQSLEGYRKWAQQKGKGLWKDPDATAPWTFRRQQSMSKPKSS